VRKKVGVLTLKRKKWHYPKI